MRLILALLLVASPVLAQTNGGIGGTLPATCVVGSTFIKTGASAGPYWCSATNTWTASGGSGSSAWADITGKPAAVTSLSGTNTGDQTTVSGNAGSATVLQNARTINGVSFNGSANVVVPAAGSTLTDTVPFNRGGIGGCAPTSATNGTMTVSMTTRCITITPTGAATFNASGGVAGQMVTFSITTSGASSFVLTWGTNFRKTGTLATGVTTARFFTVTFLCLDGTVWTELSRTAVQS